MEKLAEAKAFIKSGYKKTWLQWVVATIVFFMISWFYMGAAITSCSSYTPAFNSDTSGGIGWFQWVSGNTLNWEYSTKSNYPIGESLERPQFVTSEASFFPYRILSVLTSPVCGINLMILLGYMTTALTMFGLVKWLFKRTGIAYFAGFAAAYLPFHQLKSESHIIYGFGTAFVLIIWAYLAYVQKPSYKRATLLALATALGFYTDGYFILFTGVLVSALLGALIIRNVIIRPGIGKRLVIRLKNILKNILTYWKSIALFGLILAVLLAPIVYTQHKHAADIQESLSSARGNIQAEAKTYGARPAEFFLPSYNNPFLPSSYRAWRLTHQHYSNPSEDTLYLGLTIIVLAVVAIIMAFKEKVRRIKIKENLTFGYVVASLGLAALACAALSMPSHLIVLGHSVAMPAALLIMFTSKWRVLSRFVLVIDPLIVVLAASGFYVLARHWSKKKYALILALCFGLLFLEYSTFPFWHSQRPGADIYKSSPSIYQQLAKDSNVKTIAEYPLLDLTYGPTYFTFQQVHGKNLINANDAAIDRDAMNLSIAGLNDAQTVGVLKAKGVNVITSYGMAVEGNPNVQQYKNPDSSTKKIGLPTLYSYTINPEVIPRPYVLTAASGYDFPSIDTKYISHHSLGHAGVLKVESVTQKQNKPSQYNVSFDISALSNTPTEVVVTDNDAVLWKGQVSMDVQTIDVTVSSSGTIRLTVSNPVDVTNMQVLSVD